MAYVITDTCTKDEHCIETCPVNCIHPTKDEADFATVPQLYVNPANASTAARAFPSAQPALCLLWTNYRKNCNPLSKRTPPTTTDFSRFPQPGSPSTPSGSAPILP